MRTGKPLRPTPSPDYFLLYDTQDFGRDKRRFFQETVETVRDRIFDVLRLPSPIRLAMFGSATPRNTDDAMRFLADVRPGHVGQDRIDILERDPGRCQTHANHLEKLGRQDIRLIEADMNAPVLDPASVHVLLIDYTMAFNVALTTGADLDVDATDQLYRSTITQAATALSPDGVIVLNANLHPEDDADDYLLRFEPAIRTYATAIREQHLHALLAEVGLDPGYGVEIPNVVWNPAKRWVVRRAQAGKTQTAA